MNRFTKTCLLSKGRVGVIDPYENVICISKYAIHIQYYLLVYVIFIQYDNCKPYFDFHDFCYSVENSTLTRSFCWLV